MPVPATLLDMAVEPAVHVVDARWTMAYAAALGDPPSAPSTTRDMAIVGITDISPGARVTTRLTTVDADGRPVATTTQHAIHLRTPTDGVDRPDPSPPGDIAGAARHGEPVVSMIELDAGAAHVDTECARIWNSIHTDGTTTVPFAVRNAQGVAAVDNGLVVLGDVRP